MKLEVDEATKVGTMLKNGQVFRKVKENCWSLDRRIQDMQETDMFFDQFYNLK